MPKHQNKSGRLKTKNLWRVVIKMLDES